ncbi:hypothetical protein J8J27_33020, partial [Mycobacterium tuberculosis]|nr:hypothetical protein [Mycobacterium tuberculosis]
VWDRAHNVFLEFALGVGVPAAAGVLVALYAVLTTTFVIGWRRRRRLVCAPITGIAILVLLTLHSLVDFSLQIPGMAVFAVAA